MAEDIHSYTFDFGKEVLRFRRQLGPLADTIIFADVGSDHRYADPKKRAFMRKVIGSKKMQALAQGQVGLEDFADVKDEPSTAQRILPLELYALPDDVFNPIVDGIYNGKHNELILGHAILINQASADDIGKKFHDIHLLCTLYHETAHALIERGPTVDKLHPQRECDADAFAALMLLKRFGQEAVPYLRLRSWLRANDAATYGDTTHFTSTVIDKIIYDSRHEDFSALTIDDMIARAQIYTDKYTPSPAVLKKARLSFGRMIDMKSPVKWLLRDNSRVAFQPNALAVYIAAKNILPALYPDMRAKQNKKPDAQNISDAHRLMQHATTIKFSAIFNNSAVKPAKDAKTSRSPSIADMIAPQRKQEASP